MVSDVEREHDRAEGREGGGLVTCDLGVVGDADAADAVVPRRRYLARTPRAVAATHKGGGGIQYTQ